MKNSSSNNNNSNLSYCIYHQDSIVKYICCEKNCQYEKLCCGDCFVDNPHTSHKAKRNPDVTMYLNELIQYVLKHDDSMQTIIPDLKSKISQTFDNIQQMFLKELNEQKESWFEYINDKLIINQEENQILLASIQPSIFFDNVQNSPEQAQKIIEIFAENLSQEHAYQRIFQNNQKVELLKEKICQIMDRLEQDLTSFVQFEMQDLLPHPEQVTNNTKNYIDMEKFKGISKKQYSEHKMEINSLLYLGNSLFASGSDDQTIKIWNLNSPKSVATITGFEGIVNHLTLLNDELFACRGGAQKNEIFVINYAKNYSIVKRLQNCHEQLILKLECLNKQTLATCSGDQSIKFWNIQTGEMTQELVQAHTQTINDITLFNNNLLISSSEDKTIKMWNLTTYETVCQRQVENNYHARLLKLNQTQFASGSLYAVFIWTFKDNKIEPVNNYQVHKHWITQLINVNKYFLASCAEDANVKIVNWKSGKCIFNLEKNTSQINAICRTNNNILLSAGKDGTIYEWK